MKKIFLEEMTWPEAKEAFSETNVAILPSGSIEQHGHHMPLGTDIIIARTICRKLGEKLGNVIVVPPLSYGYCEYHQDFPGTLTITNEAFYHTAKGVCDSLAKWGIKYIININGHGGNKPSLDRISSELRNDGVLLTTIEWWNLVGSIDSKWKAAGHADVIETSAVWSCRPDVMRMDQAKAHQPIPLGEDLDIMGVSRIRFRGQTMPTRLRTSEATATGNFGDDPNNASKEMGDEAIAAVVDFMADYINAIRKVEIKKLYK